MHAPALNTASLAPILAIALLVVSRPAARAAELGFDTPLVLVRSQWFDERAGTMTIEPGIRVHVNVPLDAAKAERTRVLLYALPNGNTIEQTLGCQTASGLDWRYDIQHVAAQVRLLRSLDPSERLVLVCAEAGGLSWPAWRARQAGADAQMRALADDWRRRFGGDEALVTLAGHSGGGSFLFGVIEGGEAIPDWIDRIAFLDANYAFDATRHAARLEHWLAGNAARRLVVLAYDDREITLDGRRVVGPDGGTWRATQRMRAALEARSPVHTAQQGPFVVVRALDGRVRMDVHPNPENRILHTALVGDMNGLVHAQLVETAAESTWRGFGGPRAYTAWIQRSPQPASAEPPPALAGAPRADPDLFPPRPLDAPGGTEVMRRIASLSLEEREAVILAEIMRGNLPEFLRAFHPVPLRGPGPDGEPVTAVIEVLGDYLAVGSDDDFARVPLTPQTAQQIADRFGCVLPTPKIVDAIDRVADIQLEPRPLTQQREAVATFVRHNQIIQSQRQTYPLGALVCGIKKDVVLTPRIFQRPERLAIYGWRKLDGQPVQNVTIVHGDRYVDYSHGIRLVKDTITVDGQPHRIPDLLRDSRRWPLVSDEGPMDPPRYP